MNETTVLPTTDLSTLLEAARAIIWIRDNAYLVMLGAAVIVGLQLLVLVEGRKQ